MLAYMPALVCAVRDAFRIAWIVPPVFAAPAIAPKTPPEPGAVLALAWAAAKPRTVEPAADGAAPPLPAARLPRMLSGVTEFDTVRVPGFARRKLKTPALSRGKRRYDRTSSVGGRRRLPSGTTVLACGPAALSSCRAT